ncbi:unnamed protein product [Parnassius apollo]|uniref:(apollo) hypothetical protein n=1 Tax=Parnassius apollo TaxID=110799 RepID=A0A8S3WM48_PARAO|nr:unnamed protein product [Parnassius apollo]
MPATKDHSSKYAYSRSISQSGMSMSAKVYHPATNLLPPSPPLSPTGVAPAFGSSTRSTNTWTRQNSQSNGKYS